jgi:hypothetical protein
LDEVAESEVREGDLADHARPAGEGMSRQIGRELKRGDGQICVREGGAGGDIVRDDDVVLRRRLSRAAGGHEYPERGQRHEKSARHRPSTRQRPTSHDRPGSVQSPHCRRHRFRPCWCCKLLSAVFGHVK